MQGRWQHFGRGVEVGDTAGLELGGVRRVEDQIPGVVRHFHAAQGFGNLDLVDANGGEAPRPGNQVGVAGVDRLELGHEGRIQIDRVGNLRPVKLQKQTCFDLRLGECGPWHHDVIASIANDQFGLKCLVAFKRLVIDFDAGFFFEIGHHIFGDVIRPVVDVQNLFLSRCRSGYRRCRSRSHGLFLFTASHQNGRQSAA